MKNDSSAAPITVMSSKAGQSWQAPYTGFRIGKSKVRHRIRLQRQVGCTIFGITSGRTYLDFTFSTAKVRLRLFTRFSGIMSIVTRTKRMI